MLCVCVGGCGCVCGCVCRCGYIFLHMYVCVFYGLGLSTSSPRSGPHAACRPAFGISADTLEKAFSALSGGTGTVSTATLLQDLQVCPASLATIPSCGSNTSSPFPLAASLFSL